MALLVILRPARQLWPNAFGRAEPHALCGRRDKSSKTAAVGSFRKKQKVPGVTIVHNKASALRALKELERLKDRSHSWDTEAANVGGILRNDWRSPVTHGRVLCATCFCGDDADFGNGPRLLIDNDGPAEGLLHRLFKEYFEDTQFKKVFHNYSFDRHLLARHDIRVRGFHADTLHLARLFDTSLASWEGKVQRAQARAPGAAAEQQMLTNVVASAASPKRKARVQNVTLGGMSLERQSWSAGSSMLHTSVSESSNDAVGSSQIDRASGPSGYGLKDLTRYYGLSEKRQGSFSELFGSHATAAEDAHNSPEHFEDWSKYATDDAVLTHRLFEHFHKELVSRPWCSAVHQRPIAEIMKDPGVVAHLKAGRGSYGLTTQFDTGRTMWDFFELYLRDFGECLADLEEIGINVDCEALACIEEKAQAAVDQCHGEFVRGLDAARGPDGVALVADADLINIRSSQQMQTLLFGGSGKNSKTGDTLDAARTFPATHRSSDATLEDDEDPLGDGEDRSKIKKFELKGLGLSPISKRRNFTASGTPSTSAAVLKDFAGKGSSENAGEAYKQLVERGISPEQARLITHSLQQLREAKTTKTLITGFAQPLQEYGKTGRIHPQWKFDTSTGRLACRKPNLQNLPAGARDRYSIRSAFQAGPGNTLVVADYSQLEMRVLAHVTNCSSMIENLSRGGDYHSEVTVEMFSHVEKAVQRGEVVVDDGSGSSGLPTIKEKFSQERNQAKAVNFSIIFGKEASTLAEDLNIGVYEAEDLIAAWYRRKPEVKKWRKQTITESCQSQKALSVLGRWRTLPLIGGPVQQWRRRSERAAVNFAIQGSSADVVLAAMLRIWKSPELKELGFRLVLQVHDEFVLEGPEESATKASDLVRDFMSEPFKEHRSDFRFKVPLTADVAIAKSFSDAKA